MLTHRLLADLSRAPGRERPLPLRELLSALALLVRAAAVDLRATVHGAGAAGEGDSVDRVLAQLDALLGDPTDMDEG